jgi:hypothetical protein
MLAFKMQFVVDAKIEALEQGASRLLVFGRRLAEVTSNNDYRTRQPGTGTRSFKLLSPSLYISASLAIQAATAPYEVAL